MSNIDDIFKKNLDNKGIKYSEVYWDDMEKLLDKKKKEKSFFKAGILAFAILTLLIGSFLFSERDKNQQKPLATAVLQQSGIPESKASNESVTSTDNTSEVVIENKSAIEKNIEKRITDKQAVQIQDNKPDVQAESVVNNKIEETRSIIPSESVINSTSNNEIPSQDAYDRLFPLPLKVFATTKMTNENMLLAYNPDFKAAVKGKVETGEKNDTLKQSAKWRYYLAPGFEYDRYTRTVNNSLLKENERTIDRSGLNINFVAKKKSWGFKSGFGIMQLSEQTNYVSVNKSYTFDTSYRMINPNYDQTQKGSRVALIKRQVDTTVTSHSTIDNPDSKVYFTYLKIPLMATYELNLKQFSVYLDAGLNTAFLMKKKGNYTSFENDKYVVRDVNKNNDINKVLFQASATIGLKYRLGQSLNIYGGYGMSRSLNSMVKSYDQKPDLKLFTFGLEIKL